jgi:hypothetical protein
MRIGSAARSDRLSSTTWGRRSAAPSMPEVGTPAAGASLSTAAGVLVDDLEADQLGGLEVVLKLANLAPQPAQRTMRSVVSPSPAMR